MSSGLFLLIYLISSEKNEWWTFLINTNVVLCSSERWHFQNCERECTLLLSDLIKVNVQIIESIKVAGHLQWIVQKISRLWTTQSAIITTRVALFWILVAWLLIYALQLIQTIQDMCKCKFYCQILYEQVTLSLKTILY